VIVSSVVPDVMHSLGSAIIKYFHVKPIVPSTLDMGLKINTEHPKEIGPDRIVDAVAAYEKYGGPVIVVDFGTATTFNIISENNEFIGGVIAPGIKGSLDSLVNGTAKLPRVEIEAPKSIIAKNTVTNMQAGIVFGFAGLVEYIVKRIKKELKATKVKTIATGGFSTIIAKEIEGIDVVDKLLTLKGLKYLYDLNTKFE
jgi:type III pantothenate kinase